MNNEDLLKHIAETAYNVGFGAKKHFATYDIVDKTPGLISFLSMSFGVYALVFDGLSTKFLSASFIVLGIIGLYISLYDSKKDIYEKYGIELTKIFNELNKLYIRTKTADENNLSKCEQELTEIENRFYENCNSKQILFSDWFAHYKFFWQFQIDWVNEQKQFKFFRDKVPLTLSLTVLVLLGTIVFWGFDILNIVCSIAATVQ
ncbi:MAG: SLATT domain-containing protein [Pseudomonadota bacterium]